MYDHDTPGVLVSRRAALRGSLAAAAVFGLDLTAPGPEQDSPLESFKRRWAL